MSETIERLDYTKAPPGYAVEEIPAIERASERDKRWRARSGGAYADRWTEAEAVSAAWTHYRNRTDPPGMHPGTDRAAAWAGYDRRVELIRLAEAEMAAIAAHDRSAAT